VSLAPLSGAAGHDAEPKPKMCQATTMTLKSMAERFKDGDMDPCGQPAFPPEKEKLCQHSGPVTAEPRNPSASEPSMVPSSAEDQPSLSASCPAALASKTVDEKKDKKSPFKIPETLTMLFISVFAYLSVFTYELGFCSFFNIPPELIRPDVTTFLIYGFLALSFLAVLFQLASTYYILYDLILGSKARKRPYWRLIFSYAPPLVIAFTIILLNNFRSLPGYFILAITALFFAYEIIVPLNLMKIYKIEWCIPCFGCFLSIYQERKSNMDLTLPLQKEMERKGFGNHLLSLLFLLWVTYLSFILGNYMAEHRDTFLCRDTPRKEVVLRVYGTMAITARRDDSGKVYPEFRIIKLEDSADEFTLKKVGKLSPQLPETVLMPRKPVLLQQKPEPVPQATPVPQPTAIP